MEIEEKDDLILPEGFEEGKDIFTLADEEEAPTTEQIEEAEEIDMAEEKEEEEAAPTTEQEEPEPVSKTRIKVKFNHEEREMDEDEAAPLIQKGLNYEKVVSKTKELEGKLGQSEKLAKMMGYTNADEMIAAAERNFIDQKVAKLVDEGVHEAIARDLVARELDRNQPEKTTPIEDTRDKDLDEFVRLNPGVTKLPEEVVEAVKGGVPLTVAYERFKNKQAQDELKILKQNQSSAAKAPVGPATKHGSTKQKAKDVFEIGFDSDDW